MAKWQFITGTNGTAWNSWAATGKSSVPVSSGRPLVDRPTLYDDGTGLAPGDVNFANAKAAVLATFTPGNPNGLNGAVCVDDPSIIVRNPYA